MSLVCLVKTYETVASAPFPSPSARKQSEIEVGASAGSPAKTASQLRPTHMGTTPGLRKAHKRPKAPLPSYSAPTRPPSSPFPVPQRAALTLAYDDADPRLESKVACRSVVRAPRPPRWLCRVVVFCDRGCVIGIVAGEPEKMVGLSVSAHRRMKAACMK